MILVAVGLFVGNLWASGAATIGSGLGIWLLANTIGSDGVSHADTSPSFREFIDRAAWMIGSPLSVVIILCVAALGLRVAAGGSLGEE